MRPRVVPAVFTLTSSDLYHGGLLRRTAAIAAGKDTVRQDRDFELRPCFPVKIWYRVGATVFLYVVHSGTSAVRDKTFVYVSESYRRW